MKRTPQPILGTILDGDLTGLSIRHGRGPTGRRWLASLPWEALSQHMLVVGATGTGRTITLLRIVAAVLAAARANSRCITGRSSHSTG
jgi:ABC-type molybdenum transport system ATPase subunit/photorepair protein PhrA